MAVITYIIYGFLAVVLFTVGYLVWRNKTYNWTVYVKEIVHDGHKKYYLDKARIFYDEVEKSKFLQLLNTRDPLISDKRAVLPLPPENAIYFGFGGKNVVEIYKTQQGVYAYAIDKETGKPKQKANSDGTPSIDEDGNPVLENPEYILSRKYQYIVDKTIVPEIEPFTTEQRIIYARRMERAMSRKKHTLLDVIERAAVPIILGMIVIALLAFWGDMGKPLLEMADKVNAFEETHAQSLDVQERILDKLERLESGEQYPNPVLPDKLPPIPAVSK